MRRLEKALVCFVIAMFLFPAVCSALSREETLEMGLRDNEQYSLSLVEEASSAGLVVNKELLKEAIEQSPDLPGLYFRLAWVSLPNLFKSAGLMLQGFRAYGRNFSWAFSLSGLFYIGLILSTIISLAAVALIRLPVDVPLLVHDINESKCKFLVPLVVFSFSALGPILLISGVLFLAALYFKKNNKSVFYLSVLLVMLSPLLLKAANIYFSSSYPSIRAIAAVNEGTDNTFATQVLKENGSFEERFSLALALKRTGEAGRAIKIFTELANQHPEAMVFNNLGNAYMAAGRREAAKEAYKKALDLGDSAVPVYNLSQVYRDELNYEVGDKYFDQAMSLDRASISEFTAVAGKHYNRLVIDMTLSGLDLWMLPAAYESTMIEAYPVRPIIASAAGLGLLLLFMILDKGMKSRAFRCSRCSRVVCRKCGGRGGQLCHDCYGASVRPDESTPKARVARMLSASGQRQKVLDRMRVLSFLPPGIAQVYAGRVLAGFFYFLAFLYPLVLLVINPMFPAGLATFSHAWLPLPMIVLAVSVYVISFVSVNRRLERGWL